MRRPEDVRTLAVLGVAAAVLMTAADGAASIRVTSPASPDWDAQLAVARTIDVNTAGVAELERLPGIGPKLAERIAAERDLHGPFQGPDDLRQRVRGLGPAALEKIEKFIAFE